MLEVQNLTKIYKNKKGINTKALDGVSLNFPETGMVFLLGKSGSGKSTLLNVIGGLDSPTSGEIIVKGRSSKDFSQSDFDSYRNTFVGFIFQEYNILNEFTVEDNIALALELQNKSKDKEAIASLLESVDLSGFAKRKPNTLSGGQKQRIAIARALIKNPEIIMADEPTGALDSNTGKQVLDTLKKLSKDTLVIVVSHDREFAETYGDRIIELKDGKVISDISKTNEEREDVSKNVSIFGTTLVIKSGSSLTDQDFLEIKEFIKGSNKDVVLSKGEKEVEVFKKVNKINDSGEKEVFKDTNKESIEIKNYTKEESKFIKSRLPLRHAFKIGASSLKYKPIRLFFTIILCTISFVLFGLLSTMTFYDSKSTFKETLKDSDYSYIKLTKEYQAKETTYSYGEEEWSFDNSYYTRFYEDEYKDIIEEYGNGVLTAITTGMKINYQNQASEYWNEYIMSVGYLEKDNTLRNTITGSYPIKDNEILISSYIADAIINNKVLDGKTNKVINADKKENIIGKHLAFGSDVYKVVGIFDSGEINSKYDKLKQDSDDSDFMLINEYIAYLNDELHLMAFVTKDKLEVLNKQYPSYGHSNIAENKNAVAELLKDGYKFDEYANSLYDLYTDDYKGSVIYLNKEKELSNNETIINYYLFGEIMSEYLNDIANNSFEYNEELWDYIDIANKVREKGYYTEDGYEELTNKQLENYINKLIRYYNSYENSLKIVFKTLDYYGTSISEVKEFKVIGVTTQSLRSHQGTILFNKKTNDDLWNVQKNKLDYYSIAETKYEPKETIYDTIYLPFDGSEEMIEKLYVIHDTKVYNEDDSKYILTSYVVDNLAMVEVVVEELSKVFLYAGLILAAFAIMLFSNFISVSISNKKNEIGILRAIGARGIDVFKIFFSESFVITLICVILSSVGCIVVCKILNNVLAIGVGIAIFVFGITSFVVMVLIALITSIIATLLPVYLAARKKPVDSIRAI